MNTVLPRGLALLLLVGALAGCGQAGPLRQPDPPAAPPPAPPAESPPPPSAPPGP
ncbi:MAG TPA: hypothetical protein VFV27_01220 [Nevskiaceae bacterium]|nr:hypothetical protein [Nevskiaceae bacterium]